MHPVFLKIPVFGGITIHSYGVMVALGFVAAILWVSYESRRLGQDPSKAVDLVFYVIIAAIVGSRILHVAVSERDRFFADPLMFFKVWEGGLVFYGGLAASFGVSLWFVRRNKISYAIMVDIFAPAIALGHAIGRIGCLLAGCCYGRVVGHSAWYSIVFPAVPKTSAPIGVDLYPTQLMESAGELIIFGILFLLRRFQRFDGQIMATYLILYALLRSFVELYRGDSDRGFLIEGWLSTSQFISVIIFAVGVLIYAKYWRKGRTEA